MAFVPLQQRAPHRRNLTLGDVARVALLGVSEP